MTLQNRLAAAALTVVLMASGAIAGKHPESRKLTVAEMELLVRSYIADVDGTKDFGLQDNGDETHYPGFRYFDVLTHDPNAVFASLDHVAVDEITGDLWFANGCVADESPQLKEAQRRLRNRLGMSATDYRRLRRPGPYCDGTPYVP
jgi:hypothetical protein